MEELYKKYRPQTFEEMVGNETAIKSLEKELDNGSHAFLMVGESGTGKCVDGNTIVAMNNGLYRISELVSDAKDGFNDYKQKLCSAESNGFLTSHFYKEKVNRTHRITLSNGIDIEGTPAHPLLIINSKTGKTEWKPMSEIVEGDTIISRTGTNVYGNDTVHNYTFIPKKNDTHNKIRDYCIPLNFNIGRLLGYLVANAIWDNNFKFTTGNEKIADDFINIIKTYFDVDVYRFVDKKCPRKVPCYTISKSVSMAILSMYDTKNMKWEIARYKHVPDVVLHGNKELQRGFLIGMIECDASYDGFNIELSTASYQMKQEIMSMFNNMGLLAWTGKKYLKSYDWTYYRIHTDYLSICNLYEDYKSLKYDFTKTVRVNPNKRTWTLPACVFNDYKKWREAHITKSGHIKGTNIRNKPVRFNKTNNITERIVNELVRSYMNYDNQLAYYAYAFSLYGWKYYQVKSNEIIDKETYVYDLTVPETHCFIANGIVSHNTTLARIVAKKLGASDVTIKEINSSNNRGIDTAREIMEEMMYAPLVGDTTVYILDECHQITPVAQNSFLKALEDTPNHVYFFLCTTDPQKLIAPLKTRCSVINLQPLDDKDMQFLIKRTARAEKLSVSADVVDMIIEIAHGSSRKALKELQKVLYLEDEEEKLELLKADLTTDESESIELCRLLVKKGTTWGELAKVIKTMNLQDAERVRQSVMGYMNSVLLNGKRLPEAVSALQAFSQANTFNNGKFAITVACLDYLDLLG